MEMNGVTPSIGAQIRTDDKSCRARFNAFWDDSHGAGDYRQQLCSESRPCRALQSVADATANGSEPIKLRRSSSGMAWIARLWPTDWNRQKQALRR
jgi:hypothetical protein